MTDDLLFNLGTDWTYMIAPESLAAIKIGKVTSEKMYSQRFKQIQAMNHERLFCLAITAPGNGESERRLHTQFSKHRLHGEWFAPHQTIIRKALMYRDAKIDRHVPGLAEWMMPHDLLIGVERIYRNHARLCCSS
jgi:hypothetical protein